MTYYAVLHGVVVRSIGKVVIQKVVMMITGDEITLGFSVLFSVVVISIGIEQGGDPESGDGIVLGFTVLCHNTVVVIGKVVIQKVVMI